MEWHIFPENERRSPAPAFRLPSNRGKPFALDDNRGWGNLVLFFAHGKECPACQAALQEFAARRLEYGAVDAQVVPILPQTAAEIAGMPYPFPVVADPQGTARRQYAELVGVDGTAAEADGPVLFFVLDRYGAAYAAAVLHEPEDPELQPELLEWLDFIELQCPE